MTGTFLAETKTAFEVAGYEVQITCLMTAPFPQMVKKLDKTPALV